MGSECPRPSFEHGQETLVEVRIRLLEQAYDLLEQAEGLEEALGRSFIARAPLQIPEAEEVVGIMLTKDGQRPYLDEDKEHIMIYFPGLKSDVLGDEEQKAKWTQSDGLIWIKEHNTYPKKTEISSLTPDSFLPYVGSVEELQRGLAAPEDDSRSQQNELSELTRLRERFERYVLTPLTGR